MLIVRDTRESGEMLQAALAAGVSAAGGEALLGGVLPTPAAPLLIKRYGFDLAAVISASHNPYRDNGIKFFAADGFKLCDEQEQAIEASGVATRGRRVRGPGRRCGAGVTTGVPTAIRMLASSSRSPARAGHRQSGMCGSCAARTRTTCASWSRALPICALTGSTC